MLYYLLFWMFMGFIIHFYTIFGQFLLLPCFRVSKKRKTKRSPIDLKLHGTHFWKERSPEDLECTSGDLRGGHEAGAPHPPGHALHPHGPLVAPLTYFFRLYISIYPKNIRGDDRSWVPPPEASVATKNQSRPVPRILFRLRPCVNLFYCLLLFTSSGYSIQPRRMLTLLACSHLRIFDTSPTYL